MTKAFISMGLIDRIESLNLELARSPNPDEALSQRLKEKADKIVQEFKQNLSRPGAYLGLKKKLKTLEIVNKLLQHRENYEKLKNELNQRFGPEIKDKMDILKMAREKLLKGDSSDENLIEEVENAKQKLVEVLKSARLGIRGTVRREMDISYPEIGENFVKVDREIKHEIENVVSEIGIGWKIDELKVEAMKDSNSEKVKKLEAEIKEVVASALSSSPLKERLQNLSLEHESSDREVVGGSDGADNDRW